MRHVLSPMIGRLIRPHYVDLAEMEEDLRESGLEWTVVRPPRLNDKPFTGAIPARVRTQHPRRLRHPARRRGAPHAAGTRRAESIGQYVGVAT